MKEKNETEGIEQKENKQEEKCVEKCESCQAPAWVDDDAEDFLRRFGWVLQNIPGVQAHKAPDINTETAQAGNHEDKDPAGQAPKTTDNDILHEVQRDHPQEHARPGRPHDDDYVIPERRAAGLASQVLKVGEHIGCVGE